MRVCAVALSLSFSLFVSAHFAGGKKKGKWRYGFVGVLVIMGCWLAGCDEGVSVPGLAVSCPKVLG